MHHMITAITSTEDTTKTTSNDLPNGTNFAVKPPTERPKKRQISFSTGSTGTSSNNITSAAGTASSSHVSQSRRGGRNMRLRSTAGNTSLQRTDSSSAFNKSSTTDGDVFASMLHRMRDIITAAEASEKVQRSMQRKPSLLRHSMHTPSTNR